MNAASAPIEPQTWHHGLIAQWWAEFNDAFRAHEIPYFQSYIESGGEPALDVGCGTGRLLLPYRRAGLDVDGCDLSADMVAACRAKATAIGIDVDLYVQPMHDLDLPRRYRTIFVCGSFGLGSTRERDMAALRGFRELLDDGGTLLVDIEVPYADPHHWEYWPRQPRAALPETQQAPNRRRRAADGSEYGLHSRIVSVDPLRQRVKMEMHAVQWRDGAVDAEEVHTLDIGMYFMGEMLMMLELAGFDEVEVHGEHVAGRQPSADDEFLVFVAR